MSAAFSTWQAVQVEVLRRIRSREWKPGEMIPNEAELAEEFGCARATVNRALRGLAETGLLDRRRKAGTRVTLMPVRRATLDIPVIRHEIEQRGHAYGYALLSQALAEPPPEIRAQMRTGPGERLIRLVAVHVADGRPWCLEDRWLNPVAVPELTEADFSRQSANEWLVANVTFERGDIAFSAITSGDREARTLGCRQGEGLFVIDRSTWTGEQAITSVRLIFAPGYRMHTTL